MATYKHIRSNVDSKRPTTSLADGQIAINTNVASPGVFFKDSAGTGIVKVGPVHVGTSAPNSTPGAGGSTGNSKGEQWLDTSLTPAQLKVWNGSAWVGVVADELPVSKLQNGSAYQLLQTDAAGTGVEWASDIDVPGSLNVTSTAVFDSTASHPLGSAAAPTITFTGDANTGIYSPGIDQIALSTAGTSRLHVAADGKIGVGTASPATTFDINGDLTIADKIIHGGDTNTAIRFPAADTVSIETAGFERVRVDNAGNLGVGTSSPSVKLDVDGDVNIATSGEFRVAGTKVLDATSLGSAVVSSSLTSVGTIGTGVWNGTAIATAYIADSAVTSAKIADGTIINADVNASAAIAGTKISPDFGSQTVTTTGLISADGKVSFPLGTAALPSLYPGSDTNTGIYSPGADQVAISTNGTQRLAIDSSGRVGIGTTSPITRLHVNSGTTDLAGILESSDANVFLAFKDGSTSGNQQVQIGAVTNNLVAYAGGSERLRIDSSGNVGINASSPGRTLDVDGVIRADGTSGSFELGDNSSTPSVGCAIHRPANNTMAFVTGTNERLRIDSSGNVGIGETSPAAGLDVKVDTNPVLAIDRGSANTANFNLQYNGTTTGQLSAANGDFQISAAGASTPISFYANGSERMRIDSSGRLLVGTSTSVSTGSTTQASMQISSLVGTAIRRNTNDSGAPNLAFGKSRNTTDGSFAIVQNNDGLGSIRFAADDGTDMLTNAALIEAFVDGTPGANDMPGRLVFSTTADGASSPTERMRITSGGAIQSFDSSDNGLNVRSSSAAGTAANLMTGWHSATNTTNGTYSYNLYSNGNVVNTNNSYGAISDIKLKENIVDATSQWYDIKALRPVNYNFKEGQTHTQLGLIAQEVELVSPGLVSESPDRDEDGNDLGTITKSVNYSVLYMKAVKALQEAMERIETLEQRLTDAGIA